METLHYPGAGETKRYLEQKLQRETQARIEAENAAELEKERLSAEAAAAADREMNTAFMKEMSASAGRVAKDSASGGTKK